MPVTHSDLFHSWRIRPGAGAAAAAPRGDGADGRWHCRWIAPVTCLKQVPAAGRLRARRAAPGGSLRVREDQHGAPLRAGRGPLIPPEYFLPAPAAGPQVRHRFPTGRHQELLWPRLSQQRHQSHQSQGATALTLVDGTWSLCPYLPPRGRLPGGFTSLAESVSETCSNTDQEIALSNSKLCIFCQD
jgi:hypothetical protein